MLKLTTWIVISIFLLSPLVFVGCSGCSSEEIRKASKKVTQDQEEDYTRDFYVDDKVVVKVQTPSGEKTYEGTLIRWWANGVVIKTESGRVLMGIAGQVFTVEKNTR